MAASGPAAGIAQLKRFVFFLTFFCTICILLKDFVLKRITNTL